MLIVGANLQGALTVKGSKGGESVRVDGANVADRATFALGAGGGDLSLCNDMMADLIVKFGTGGASNRQSECTSAHPASSISDNALTISDVTGGTLSVKTSAADDGVTLGGDTFTGSTKLDLGKGINAVSLLAVAIDHRLTYKGDKDSDSLVATQVAVSENLILTAAGGNNNVLLSTSAIGGDLSIKTGNGNDNINTTGTAVGGSTTIKHGKGTDSITP
jgi:hypothetical protein